MSATVGSTDHPQLESCVQPSVSFIAFLAFSFIAAPTRHSIKHPLDPSLDQSLIGCTDLAHFFFLLLHEDGCSNRRGDEKWENTPLLFSASFSSSWTTVHDNDLSEGGHTLGLL